VTFRRKGAIKSKPKFDVLNIFKGKFAINRNYYVLFVFMSILAAASIYTNFVTNRKLSEESFEVFKNNSAQETEEVESSISESLQDATSNNNDTRKTQDVQTVATSSNIAKVAAKPKVVPLSFSIPLDGEIIKGYSTDKLIYSNTLESWKTHDGLDIKAEIGKSVKSIEKGISKVNIFTDLTLAAVKRIREEANLQTNYLDLNNAVLEAINDEAVKKIRLFGSNNKA
jgi:murein DD-endopeptidase MepM/ murein hydrolase activator NlpD